jgi:hypothetical protein
MSCSEKITDMTVEVDNEIGTSHPPAEPSSEHYHQLEELMAIVEALCPVWPPREPFRAGCQMLL